MRSKPKVLLDIRRREIDVFSRKERRINLSYTPAKSFRLKQGAIFIASLMPLFFLGSVLAPVISGDILAQTISSEEREKLEVQLQKLEAEIAGYEKTIGEYQKQGTSLKNEIKSLEARIAKSNLEIQATKLSLAKLDNEISLTTKKINELENEISSNREVLSEAIRSMYRSEDQGLMEVLLQNPKLSDFFGNINSLLAIQDNLRASLERLKVLKNDLLEEKEKLGLERADVAATKSYQESRKEAVETTKQEKDSILKITKGKESEYKKLLTETRKTAAQIRSRIFELLGGGELTFEQAYKFAKFAEASTGIRSALILAVLDRESALGQNVGRCKYNDLNTASGRTVMHPDRDMPLFLEITKELGINPNTVTVSCANRDGTYGGAMGPAQFIPSTWNIYKAKIAEITGSNPPSPWRHGDAFVATAIYLKDAGAERNEKIAAAKYYCGARWNRYVCLSVYGSRVAEQARRFQQDIDILSS